MKVSQRGLVEIASHEGIVPMPYLDSVGVWTWGIGHTHYAGAPDPRGMPKGERADMKEVFRVFQNDIRSYAAAVNSAVKVKVSQHEFDALVSFHYNTGAIARASLTKHLNAGNREAAANAFMSWSKPPEIITRRQKEQSLFRTGSYSSGGWASVFPASKTGRVLWSQGKRINVGNLLDGYLSREIGFETGSKPATITSKLLLPGSTGEDVRTLQRKLRILVDGIYGPITRKAVADYQKHNGLTVDGKAGPQTLGAMGLA